MGQIDIRFYVWMFFRRLPYIVLTTVIGAVAGVLFALSLPPTYLAVAKILVESPRISSDLAGSSVPTNAIEQLQIVEQRLTTRAALLDMARRYEVYPDLSELNEEDVANDMRDRTALEPLLFSTPRGSSGALMFAISFEADNPTLAADVANGYVSTILDANARLRKERAADALDFIRQEADRLGKALAQAETEITDFRNAHRDALPDTMEFRRAQQNTQQERLLQIQRQEESLRSRRLTLAQIYAQTSGVGPAGAATPEDQMLAELRRTLAEQRAVFAETSPNIVALRQRIEALESELREKRAAGTEDQPVTTGMPAELQLQFADIDSQLEFLAAERSSIERRLADLERSIGDTAENATVLGRLERNYQNAQTLYNDAQARLAEASTGARIEQEAVGEKLTLIEAAMAPSKPYGPKRRIIAAGGAAGGFGLGIALILLIEIWRGAIYRSADIAAIYEGEPLVAVPYIHRRAASARQRFLAPFLPALALLLGGPIAAAIATLATG